MSCMKRVASPGSMHDTGCLGLVHWDDPEGWYGDALLQGIFLTQGLNPCLLHWQVDSLPLMPPGKQPPPPSAMLCPISREPSDWGVSVSSPQDLTESEPCTHLLLSSTCCAEGLPVRVLWLGDFSANTGRSQVMASTSPNGRDIKSIYSLCFSKCQGYAFLLPVV